MTITLLGYDSLLFFAAGFVLASLIFGYGLRKLVKAQSSRANDVTALLLLAAILVADAVAAVLFIIWLTNR